MGRGILALVWVFACLPFSSGLLTGGEGTDCHLPLLAPANFPANIWPLPLPVSVSILANTWPQPPLALMGFLADPLPTPAPANTLFGDECGHWQITLHTSPPVTLAQEVLTLGAIMGEADRVVSAAEEDTVTMGILPPTTTWDEWDRDPTTKGHSSPLSPGKADKPAIPGLVGMRMMPQVVRRARSTYLRPTVSMVTLSWDQSYSPWLLPLQDNLMWARCPVYEVRAQSDVESLVVGLKAWRRAMMSCPGRDQDHEGHW